MREERDMGVRGKATSAWVVATRVRIGRAMLGAALIVALLVCAAAPTAALAVEEETHFFDPVLSLTGNCAVAAVDTVPDPGCPEGKHPPGGRFNQPSGVATDAYGDIYVASMLEPTNNEFKGRIDVFNSSGEFLTELTENAGPMSIAVDSLGNLYVLQKKQNATGTDNGPQLIVRYAPKVYEPGSGKIEYGSSPTATVASSVVSRVRSPSTSTLYPVQQPFGYNAGITLDSSNDRLYLETGSVIVEFGSATEGNPLIDRTIGRERKAWFSELIYKTYLNSSGEEVKSETISQVPHEEPLPVNQPEVVVLETGTTAEGQFAKIAAKQEVGAVIRSKVMIGNGGGVGISIDPRNHDIYTAVNPKPRIAFQNEPAQIQVLNGKDPEHPSKRIIDGACLPKGHFGAYAYLGVAVDASNGHVFVDDRLSEEGTRPVYEFTETGECVSMIEHSFTQQYFYPPVIAIDNGAHSPNGALDPDGRYLYVPSGGITASFTHLYAFKPKERLVHPPAISSLRSEEITDSEAQLRAQINPEGAATHYTFEYTTQERFESEGFEGAYVAGEGGLGAGVVAVQVSASLAGLTPGTPYRVRLSAENDCKQESCSDEAEITFATFPQAPPGTPCPNDGRRTGASAALPDCRAYELVTPSNTGGRVPQAPLGESLVYGMPLASPKGDDVAFMVESGLPGYPATGSFSGDIYAAARTEGGWATRLVGHDGAEAWGSGFKSLSPDHGYEFWSTFDHEPGTLTLGEQAISYVAYPDGSQHFLGTGSLGTDFRALPLFVNEGGSHILFSSSAHLEPQAPPAGTTAIYDRGAEGPTHVVSLLPSGLAPAAGQNAFQAGVSADGSAVAFRLGGELTGPIYVRAGGATLEVAGSGARFAGFSAEGRYAFYLNGGDLFRLDTESKAIDRVTASGDVTVVNIPAGGTSAYFVSPTVLAGEANPRGEKAKVGMKNLYLWDGASVRFVAVVSKRDLEGEAGRSGYYRLDGLGMWTEQVAQGTFPLDPSRTAPDGSAIVFSSNRDLSGYDSEGRTEIYRYAAGSLTCVSCPPTLVAASGNARLQSLVADPEENGGITHKSSLIPNLSPDGQRVFFESPDALVPADVDGVRDVYEWEASGKGSCTTPGGCVYLISSGQSAHDNHLFGVSESGDDAFVYTSDLLTAGDSDETPSIYDARVEGGFAGAVGPPAECLGEACQPAAVAPDDPTPASSSFEGAGNVKEEPPVVRKPCAKGKVRRQGKCVARKHAKRHHRRAKAKRRAGR